MDVTASNTQHNYAVTVVSTSLGLFASFSNFSFTSLGGIRTWQNKTGDVTREKKKEQNLMEKKRRKKLKLCQKV